MNLYINKLFFIVVLVFGVLFADTPCDDGIVPDCADVCGGSAVEDDCGVCEGDGTSCVNACLEDLDNLNSNHWWHWNETYAERIWYQTQNCYYQSDNPTSESVQACLEDDGWGSGFISNECISCSSEWAGCNALECLEECQIDLGTEECISCRTEGTCGDSWNECTGIVVGCIDINGCNYNPNANVSYSLCEYSETNFDCDGNCIINTDCFGECGGNAEADCLGECNGLAVEDCAGVCNGTAIVDCSGECNGIAFLDECGVCNGLGYNIDGCCANDIRDCEGVCGGNATEDACGVCEGENICLDTFDCDPNDTGELITCPMESDFICAPNIGDCFLDNSGCNGDTGILDCDGSAMYCCPTSWLGDGFADCSEQFWGCDLSCYENDLGDCDPNGGAYAWYCPDTEFYYPSANDCNTNCDVTCTENLNVVSNDDDIDYRSNKADYKLPFNNSTRLDCDFVYGPQADCMGECNGDATYDECGVCDGDESTCTGCDGIVNSGLVLGCDNVCGSGLVNNSCGECGGDESTCEGCDGIQGSGLVLDCMGVCDGSAEYDECGICNGLNICADDHVCGAISSNTNWITCPVGADYLCAPTNNDCYISSDGCDGTTGLPDCSGDGDCCPSSWLGDGYGDCADQEWGCDLSCYNFDDGDCNGLRSESGDQIKSVFSTNTQNRDECNFIYGPDAGCDGQCDSNLVLGQCDNVCGSTIGEDECGVCDGPGAVYECGCFNSLENYDCNGECNVAIDCLGECGGTAENCIDVTLSSTSSTTATVSYNSDVPIGGFQFDVSGVTLTETASDLGIANFNTSTGVVLGFSFTGNTLPPGDGNLIELSFIEGGVDGLNLYINNIVLTSSTGITLINNIDASIDIQSCLNNDEDDLCDAVDDCIGVYDECNVCGGSGSNGDANGNGLINVADITYIVSHILGQYTFNDIEFCRSDIYTNGSVDIGDIVFIVDLIFNSRFDLGHQAMNADIIVTNNIISINADGYIAGVQMTLSHGSDFSLELSDAYISEYSTRENVTTLILASADESLNLIANYKGEFEVESLIVMNSNQSIQDVNVLNLEPVELTLAGPNPFNPSTSLNVMVAEAGYVSVNVYNILGQKVATLLNGYMDANVSGYKVDWNASNLSSGVYLVRAETAGSISTQKLMFLK